jgi:hypothetical protein
MVSRPITSNVLQYFVAVAGDILSKHKMVYLLSQINYNTPRKSVVKPRNQFT